MIIGRPKHHLIETLRGKIVLEVALFEKLEKERDLVIGQEQKFSFWRLLKITALKFTKISFRQGNRALLAGIVLGDKDNIGYDFTNKW